MSNNRNHRSEYVGINHVQIAAPPGCEAEARRFYGDILNMIELPKPDALVARGGVWFECGAHQLHIGVEEPFQPARKAHPAIQLVNLTTLGSLAARLELEGIAVHYDDLIPDQRRFYTLDPFGNRLEFVCPAEW